MRVFEFKTHTQTCVNEMSAPRAKINISDRVRRFSEHVVVSLCRRRVLLVVFASSTNKMLWYSRVCVCVCVYIYIYAYDLFALPVLNCVRACVRECLRRAANRERLCDRSMLMQMWNDLFARDIDDDDDDCVYTHTLTNYYITCISAYVCDVVSTAASHQHCRTHE